MSPEAQQIAIAKACGWRRQTGSWNRSNPGNDAFGIRANVEIWTEWWSKRGEREVLTHELPDYLSDLNAMHEAEEVLTVEQVYPYMIKLMSVKRHPPSEKGKLHTYLFHATAAQRAEAFLRTLNLWAS